MSPSLPLAVHPELPRGPLPASGGPSLTVPIRTTFREAPAKRALRRSALPSLCVHRDIWFFIPFQYIITGEERCQGKQAAFDGRGVPILCTEVGGVLALLH